MKVAIASGKGGTGKTTLATNLAAFLAESAPVVLVDLDVEEPNAGLFVRGAVQREEVRFRLVPEWIASRCDRCGECQRVCNFNSILAVADGVMVFPELCHACHACVELCPERALTMQPRRMGSLVHQSDGALDIVMGRLDVGELQAVPLIEQTLGHVDGSFPGDRLVIIDAPPGTSCPVVAATRRADLVILVTEPTPFGLHDLQLAVATMRAIDREVRVVINRYGMGDGVALEDYCRREGLEVVARIPHSRRIAELYASGQLLYRDSADFAAALDAVATLVRRVAIGGNA
jgi:MinD superfamily P-loop ATPase